MRETPERVIVSLPKADVLRQLDADFRRSLMILAVIAVTALAATWAVAEVFVVRGVRLLTGLAHRIGGGDLAVEPPRLSGGLGVLSTALGEMAQKLKARDEALVEATAAAEEAVRAKSEFMAAMSHEIRTPLNGIIGFANLLYGTELNERQRHFTTLLKDAGQSLLKIINDILDFSKIEAGRLELETIEFSLAELLESCLALVRKAASDKGLELSLIVTPDVPRRLEGDPNRLRQVLLNLLNNAVKFTPHGRVVLSVSCLAREPVGLRLKFAVADTGIGIPAEKLSLIFEKFSQVDRTVSRKYGGTGLGLAISKRLVELMRGEIGVDSALGAGSTFWFRVTLKEAGIQPVEAAAAAVAPGAVVTPLRRSARILLAEDLPTNQILAEAILTQAGHSVAIVPDGAAALAAVQREAFDLVLMDIQMPIMDGITAAKAIRDLKGAAGTIPIVAMTANALPEEVAKCRAAGMNEHIAKPVDAGLLLAAIDRWRHGRAAVAGTSPAATILDFEAMRQLETLIGHGRLAELVERFIAELPARLAAVAQGEGAAVGKGAHALVSLSGNFGLVELSQASRALMQACKDPAKPDIATLKAELDAAASRALAAIRRFAADRLGAACEPAPGERPPLTAAGD